MRCKVKLQSILKDQNGSTVTFQPVTGGSPDNQNFFKFTPYGEIKLGVINDAVVDKLEIGGEYYVDFSRAF